MFMSKIAAVGALDSVMIFKSAGADVFSPGKDAAGVIHRLAHEKYAVIFITEEVAKAAKAEIRELIKQPFPAIVAIPGALGSDGSGMALLMENIEKAAGAGIILDTLESEDE